MTKSFKFFYDFLSPLSRSLYILFERNNVACQKIPVALGKGEHLKRDFALNVNRFRKVPVIHDSDGFKLSETVAIFHYLGRKNIIPYSNDLKENAKIDEFLSWQHNSLNLSTGKLFYDVWVAPFAPRDLPPHGMMVNVGHPQDFVILNQSLSDLENLWLRDRNFLTGNKATFADLIAACEIMQIIGLRIYELDSKKYPKVSNWLANVKQEFNPEFDEAHKKICRVGEKFGGKPPMTAVIVFRVYDFFRKLLK